MPETKDLDIHFEIDENSSWLELIKKISVHFNVPEILVKALLEMNRNSTPHDNNDRTFILDLEEEIINFIRLPNVDSWKMVPLNSYYRLLTHKISEYYQLGHILSNDGFSMVLFKKNTSLINADESTKRNAKIDQRGKVLPLNFEDLNFDPEEKLDRISLKAIYETFNEDVKRLSKNDPGLPDVPQKPPQNQKVKMLKRNINNNGNRSNNNNKNHNNNGTDDRQNYQYKSKPPLHYYPQTNYYYPPPQMMPPPPSGNEQEYPQPIYYVPIIPQDNDNMYYSSPPLPASGDGYILYPPPPQKLEEQLQKQRNTPKSKNNDINDDENP